MRIEIFKCKETKRAKFSLFVANSKFFAYLKQEFRLFTSKYFNAHQVDFKYYYIK